MEYCFYCDIGLKSNVLCIIFSISVILFGPAVKLVVMLVIQYTHFQVDLEK